MPSQLKQGDITLFTRDTSPYYYCQVKTPDTGKWMQKSTKQTDKQEAMRFAERWHTEMCFLHERGYSSTPTDFSKVCDLYIKELKREMAEYEETDGETGRTPIDLSNYITTTERYIKPYFKNTSIDTISTPDIEAYLDWRKAYWVTGPGKDIEYIEYMRADKIVKRPVKHEAAKDGALSKSIVVLNGIFDCAVRNKLLDETRAPKAKLKRAKNKKSKDKLQPKPAFSTKQYADLLAFLPKWCLQTSRDPNLNAYTDRRLLLWDWIVLIANTGMRPGTETDHIKWKHVEFYADKRGLQPLEEDLMQLGVPRLSILIPRGKRGARNTTGNIDAANALLRIRQRRSDYLNGLHEKPIKPWKKKEDFTGSTRLEI